MRSGRGLTSSPTRCQCAQSVSGPRLLMRSRSPGQDRHRGCHGAGGVCRADALAVELAAFATARASGGVPSGGKVATACGVTTPCDRRPERESVGAKLRKLKLGKVEELVAAGMAATLSYDAFPTEHWRSLRTNNLLERLNREIRRRRRLVGAFPDGESALMLVAARLRHVVGIQWGTRRYLTMG